jgi:dTDP-4-dehydrorhamnose reductase
MARTRPIAILGARGLVGSSLMKVLAAQAPLALSSNECDITSPHQVLKVMDRLRPRVFINTAAMTNVDGCEASPDQAYRVNAVGPSHLAQAAREIDCLLVHLSTDFVFDGNLGRPYREDDRPAPLSVYGRSKLAGEEAVQDAGGDWLIVRTAWLFGSTRRGFVWRILDLAGEGRDLRVVDDQKGSPTYALDLARGLAALLQVNARGLVHLVNSGEATWWELAIQTLKSAGLNSIDIKKITTEELKQPAVRPAYSVLDNGRFQRLTGTAMRNWNEALAEALRQEGDH